MAKHPVPKKKMSNARTATRYASFKRKKTVKLTGFTNVVKCSKCGAPTLNQMACKECGNYRGRSVTDTSKTMDKIIKVKA